METEWHIVYLSFEEGQVGKDYIGKHSTFDLNDGYLGSFSDKTFNPKNRIILEYAKTKEAAVTAEIRWQKVFQVVEDPQFVNKSYQTSDKFSYCEIGENHHNFGKRLWHKQSGEQCYSKEKPGPEWVLGQHESLNVALSEKMKGENNPNYGNRWKRRWTEAEIKVFLERPRGKDHHWSSLHRDMNGTNNTFYGKNHSEESKEKNRLSHTGENDYVTGTFWWVNVEGESKRSKEPPGPEWQQGRKWRN